MQLLAIGAAAFLTVAAANQASLPREAVLGTFVGTTPAAPGVLRPLTSEATVNAELVEWALTLYHDATTRAPTRYELRYTHGFTQPNHPGIARDAVRGGGQGRWTRNAATASSSATDVIALTNGLSLARFGDAVLHFLNRDGTLMTGNGGWSFTLTRAGATERVETTRVSDAPDMWYTIRPLATGANVYSVFEGRTPCQGIARELPRAADVTCQKVKWRVTLFQDPATRAPTTFRVEGSLFRPDAMEGRWSVIDGPPAHPRARVLRLAPSDAAMFLSLLQVDENVVFFLDREGRVMPGRADFSYTLDRRR